ncbi:mta/sah nucleosidase, putative [Ricinus communis]|uniref:Mta/sah nucleosidase, putative n=4 Tax=Ricinus communis TaxID=3988 RepID=B9RS28_RICCO|nr:mta/sah nucleosidase, putative [Ricinus communis]
MAALKVVLFFIYAMMIMLKEHRAIGALSVDTLKLISEVNDDGPYLGLVIPNPYEMNPLLQSPNFTATNLTIDFSGRRFRFGTIGERKVILVMTGLSLINAGITTQLLISFFNIEGVVHYGIAGNANPSLNIGDVTIPRYWAHTGLWNWQRYGKGPEDELRLEANGDYTREFGYIKFANYTVNVTGCSSYDNLLNNVWYQPEEVFPVDGTPEEREHVFWVSVDPYYFQVSLSLLDMKLEGCLNSTTCLSSTPKVVTVERGTSASIFLDNSAYRSFLYDKLNISTVDMETAAVALICLQQKMPFIAIRALSGGRNSAAQSNSEADIFTSLVADNSVAVVLEFIKRLPLGYR